MDAARPEVAERGVHRAMALDGAEALEAMGHHDRQEMAALESAGVAAMARALVLDVDVLGVQGLAEIVGELVGNLHAASPLRVRGEAQADVVGGPVPVGVAQRRAQRLAHLVEERRPLGRRAAPR